MIARKCKESRELTKYCPIFRTQFSRTSRTNPQKGKLKHSAAWQILDFTALISEIKDVQFADFVFRTHQNDLAKSPDCSAYEYKRQVSHKTYSLSEERNSQTCLRGKSITISVKTFEKVPETIPVCVQPMQANLPLNNFILMSYKY